MEVKDLLNKMDVFFDEMSENEFKDFMINLGFEIIPDMPGGISYKGGYEFSLLAHSRSSVMVNMGNLSNFEITDDIQEEAA